MRYIREETNEYENSVSKKLNSRTVLSSFLCHPRSVFPLSANRPPRTATPEDDHKPPKASYE